MSEDVRPALTPDEWRAGKAYRDRDENYALKIGHGFAVEVEFSDDEEFQYAEVGIGGDAGHALAALALHNQPYGFTWEDVDMLRAMPDGTGYASVDDPERFASVIDRIAALLPPREST